MIIRCFVFILCACFVSLVFAKDCTATLKVGAKAWEIVKLCGKPKILQQSEEMPSTALNYTIYEYVTQEPICYSTFKAANIICEQNRKHTVTFYFAENIVQKIVLGRVDIDNLFLNYNHRFVLGDTKADIEKLWFKPKKIKEALLKLPRKIQVWGYQGHEITLVNGVYRSEP